MKKIVVTVTALIGLIGCQSPINKKTNLNENQQNLGSQIIDNGTLIDAQTIIDSLNQCYLDDSCKTQLSNPLNTWLIDRNLLSENELIITDEQENEQLPKIVTNQNNNSLAKIKLSKNYMNNELIKGALNEWLTWKRPQLINTWQYYQFLKKEMTPNFDKLKIDESLVLAIMAQESGGKVHSRSRAGAGGLFQIMPATAKRLGLSGKIGAYDQRFNPEKSSLAAAQYLDEQIQLYDGDKAKVLAAYNSGENRFRRLNKKYKNKSLWNKSFYYELPRETRHYVPVVIAAMLIFQNPDKFNVKLAQLDTEVTLINPSKKTSLSELSICLGQEQRVDGWFRILRNLNSGIKADSEIKAGTTLRIPKTLIETYNTKCQDHNLMKLAKSFHEADFKETQGLFRYRVRKGDSLGKIARKFRCTNSKEIARLNNLKAPRYLIRAGKYLKVPQC
jgi:membrane-bound lytic murein transglycosylase D